MRYYRRNAVGDLFGRLWDIFMEHPLTGGLLIAAALAFFWLILPELEARYNEWYYSRPTKERMESGMMTAGTMLGILVIVVIVLAIQ